MNKKSRGIIVIGVEYLIGGVIVVEDE